MQTSTRKKVFGCLRLILLCLLRAFAYYMAVSAAFILVTAFGSIHSVALILLVSIPGYIMLGRAYAKGGCEKFLTFNDVDVNLCLKRWCLRDLLPQWAALFVFHAPLIIQHLLRDISSMPDPEKALFNARYMFIGGAAALILFPLVAIFTARSVYTKFLQERRERYGDRSR